jgi:tRNA threonylcarbamoyladenosine biosynthesis protein TsaE
MSTGRGIDLQGEAAQEAFGGRLAAVCEPPLLITLDGELGAGKTTLARGFLRALGHGGNVKSPTYTLIEPYEIGGRRVYHLDLYRLSDPAELEYLGLREMLDEDAVLLIEWPQRGTGWLPDADVQIRISLRDPGRHLELMAGSPRGEAVLRALRPDLE